MLFAYCVDAYVTYVGGAQNRYSESGGCDSTAQWLVIRLDFEGSCSTCVLERQSWLRGPELNICSFSVAFLSSGERQETGEPGEAAATIIAHAIENTTWPYLGALGRQVRRYRRRLLEGESALLTTTATTHCDSDQLQSFIHSSTRFRES